jgi:catalase
MTRAAATLHAEDDDFGQPGTLYREVFNDAERQSLLDQITGHVGAVVDAGIRERAIQYWTNVDGDLGAKLRANLSGEAPVEAGDPGTKWEPTDA